MKKIFYLLILLFSITTLVDAQYFLGSFSPDQADMNNFKIQFKMKPTGTITTSISYLEAAFRYPTATTPQFTITNITSNTATFPGLNVVRFPPDYVANGYTYVKFVFNTATIPAAAYTAETEYPLFTVTTSLPGSATPLFDMVSNLVLMEYQFGVVNGAGQQLDPGQGPQLYGTGFRIEGNDHILPLFAALPLKFTNFSAVKKGDDALLTWTIENADEKFSHFEIERSLNGADFAKIGSVQSDFPHTAIKTFSFTEKDVTSIRSSGVLFYRIKQIEKDNAFSYTSIKSIKLNNKILGVVLTPNPATVTAQLAFELELPAKVGIQMLDETGKKIRQVDFLGVKGINKTNLDVSRIPSGSYHIVISVNEQKEIVKLVRP
jgi:hypothetical protein